LLIYFDKIPCFWLEWPNGVHVGCCWNCGVLVLMDMLAVSPMPWLRWF
jgi:hypothetical protein